MSRNNTKMGKRRKRQKKRKINYKKLSVLLVLVFALCMGVAKSVQGITLIVKESMSKKSEKTVESEEVVKQFDLKTELDKTIESKYTILVDPGHGGNDVGTASFDKKVFEKDITLELGKKVATKLSKQNDIQVIISRTEDKYLGLSERSKLANDQDVDLFVSIHLNGQTGGNEANGIETYYTTGRTDGSKELAETVQKTMISYVDARDRGIKDNRFQALLECKMPAILVEAGFFSNEKEAKNLTKESYQDQLVEGIAQGVLTYLDQNKK